MLKTPMFFLAYSLFFAVYADIYIMRECLKIGYVNEKTERRMRL